MVVLVATRSAFWPEESATAAGASTDPGTVWRAPGEEDLAILLVYSRAPAHCPQGIGGRGRRRWPYLCHRRNPGLYQIQHRGGVRPVQRPLVIDRSHAHRPRLPGSRRGRRRPYLCHRRSERNTPTSHPRGNLPTPPPPLVKRLLPSPPPPPPLTPP